MCVRWAVAIIMMRYQDGPQVCGVGTIFDRHTAQDGLEGGVWRIIYGLQTVHRTTLFFLNYP